MTTTAILAVDGGNSKTEAALVDADGAVLGAARGPGASHQHLGVVGAMAALEALVVAACRDAGLDPGVRPLAEVGVWCLAGLDLPADDEALGPAIAGCGWARENLLHNDVFAVLRAGSERTWGVGVVAGAGMNCAGVAPDGTEARFPALGELSGDWGAVYLGRIAEDRVLELPPLVFAAAAAGDPVAAELVGRQVAEAATMAGAAIRRLGLTGRDVDVVLGGGLFHRDDPAFIERIRAGIAKVAPAARLRQVTAPPVVGAALLGLDRLGAAPGAAGRLRASLTHERLQALQPVAASTH